MAYEYTTTALVQAELNSSTAFSSSTYPTDTTVTTWIQEESAYLNSLADTVFSTSTAASEYIDYNGGDKLMLENAPVVSVTTLRYNTNLLGATAGASWVAKTEDTHWTLYDDLGVIHLLSKWSPNKGLKRIEATYIYGYESTPLEVQMLTTKLVAKRVLEASIMKNVNERNDGGSISVGSISIVEPASYGVNSYKLLGQEIVDLRNKVIDNFQVKRNSFHMFL